MLSTGVSGGAVRTTLGWTLAALAGGTTAWGVARRRRDPTPRRLRCIETQRLEPGCRVHLLCCDGRCVLVATTQQRVQVLARWRDERGSAGLRFPDPSGDAPRASAPDSKDAP